MWYKKYLEAYEKPFEQVGPEFVNEIREKLTKINSKSPLVSVVAIAHNEDRHLLSCLWSLVDNKIDFPIEIIVINNNSTDRTEELLKTLNAQYVNESKQSPGFARQAGLDVAKGKYYLCIDSDTLYPPYYIATMVKYLEQPMISCAYGFWSFITFSRLEKIELFFYELLRDIYLCIQQIKRPELNVRGMVFGFKTELGRKYGFRTDIIRGEDGSLALNLKHDGKLRLVTSRKVRPITCNSAIKSDGSVLNMFWKRAKAYFFYIPNLFKSQSTYKDRDSNMVK